MASQNLSIPYQDIDDRLRNIGTPADSPSESGSLHAKVKALQDEPSLHDLWLKAGATHQEETDTYTLNEVSGLTKSDMLYAWFFGKFIPSSCAMVQGEVGSILKTNFPSLIGGFTNVYLDEVNLESRFNCNSALERIRFLTSPSVTEDRLYLICNSLKKAFWQCSALTIIDNILDVGRITSAEGFVYAFISCPKLQKVRLRKIKISISFKDSPDLTVKDDTESTLGYLVENAANTEPITITLHPTAFAKVPQSLIEKAQAKQITIASA